MKKSTHFAIIALVVLAFAFTACAKTTKSDGLTIKEGVLQIAMEIGYPPFEYFDTDGKLPSALMYSSEGNRRRIGLASCLCGYSLGRNFRWSKNQ